MPTLIPSNFTAYAFTEDELLMASVFSDAQIKYLRTELAAHALTSVNLDPNKDPNAYMIERSYHKGAMDALQYIIEVSAARSDQQTNLFSNTVPHHLFDTGP